MRKTRLIRSVAISTRRLFISTFGIQQFPKMYRGTGKRKRPSLFLLTNSWHFEFCGLPDAEYCCVLGPFLSKDFLSKFPDFVFAQFFFCFHIFLFFFSSKSWKPSKYFCVKFPNFRNVSRFSCFSCYSWNKKKRKFGKRWSIRTALSTRRRCSSEDLCASQ